MITYMFIHFKFFCASLLSSLIYLSTSEIVEHISMIGLHMYVHVLVPVCLTCTPLAQLVGYDPFHASNRRVSSEWRHACWFSMRIGWNPGICPNHPVGYWCTSAMYEILSGSYAHLVRSIAKVGKAYALANSSKVKQFCIEFSYELSSLISMTNLKAS